MTYSGENIHRHSLTTQRTLRNRALWESSKQRKVPPGHRTPRVRTTCKAAAAFKSALGFDTKLSEVTEGRQRRGPPVSSKGHFWVAKCYHEEKTVISQQWKLGLNGKHGWKPHCECLTRATGAGREWTKGRHHPQGAHLVSLHDKPLGRGRVL